MDLQSFGQLMEAGEFETPQDKTLVTISAAELQKKNIPPIRFIVDGLLPAGLNILASPPKYGKSWLVLGLCLSVSIGTRFLGYKTNPCGCLYLAQCVVEGPMFRSENHHLIMERSFSLQRQLLRDAVASRSVFALFYASVCLYVPDVLSGDDHLADGISH